MATQSVVRTIRLFAYVRLLPTANTNKTASPTPTELGPVSKRTKT